MEFEFHVKYDSGDFIILNQVYEKSRSKKYQIYRRFLRSVMVCCGAIAAIVSCTQMVFFGFEIKYLLYLIIGALLFRIGRSARRIDALNSKKISGFVDEERAYRFSDRGIESTCKEINSQYSYQSIIGLFWCKDTYFLQVDQRLFLILPMRGLISGDWSQFADFIQQKTGLTVQYLK